MGDEGRERLLRNIPLLEAILALNSIVQPRYGLGFKVVRKSSWAGAN